MIANIGPVLSKQVISYFGTVESIFTQPISELRKLPRIGQVLAEEIKSKRLFEQADKEIEFCIKNNIKILNIDDTDYPQRLKQCEDSPTYFFYKGNTNFNAHKIISIVGTRNATDYGKIACEKIIEEIKHHNPIIVSGFAFGIDIISHKAALKNGLQTIAVVGSNLQQIHPSSHSKYIKNVLDSGAIISEYHTNTKYENSLFIRRNRIIAGISDITIVIESKEKGGALSTADFALQYNREIGAIPGNINSQFSAGCNQLIKDNKASLIESGYDIEKLLNWDIHKKKHAVQTELFIDLSVNEQKIMDLFMTENEILVDNIIRKSQLPVHSVSSLLLDLEFKGLIRPLPGKRYCKS